jgi:tRNA A-37 threonylcarbamoyl transferase component Bud32
LGFLSLLKTNRNSVQKLLGILGKSPWEMTFPIDIQLSAEHSIQVLDVYSQSRNRFICARAELNGEGPILAMFFFGRDAKSAFEQHIGALDCLRSGNVVLPPMKSMVFADCFIAAMDMPATLEIVRDSRFLATLPFAVRKGIVLRIMQVLGSMHRSGIGRDDLGIAGFLSARGNPDLIPLQPLIKFPQSVGVPSDIAIKNLGQVLAQLPPDFDRELPELCSVYAASAGAGNPPVDQVRKMCFRFRPHFVKNRLKEVENPSREYAVSHTLSRTTFVLRTHLGLLADLLKNPDSCLTMGTPLKLGTANSVLTIDLEGRRYVVKRYNLKNWRFFFSRLLKSSRPLKAWRAIHAFLFFGVPTAEPIALIRERLGPFYFRAWMVTDYIEAPHLGAYFSNYKNQSALPETEGKLLQELFRRMVAARLSHGDLKCTNLLWRADSSPIFIDMDGARYHGCNRKSFAGKWLKDRRRFLRNWVNTPLHQWLDRYLPSEDPEEDSRDIGLTEMNS